MSANLCAVCALTLLLGSCGEHDEPHRRLTSKVIETIRNDVGREHRRKRVQLGTCNQLVADTYRRLGKGNRRVTFKARLRIDASAGQGKIAVQDVKVPDDVPLEAKDCIIEKFPRSFVTSSEFSGELTYEMCLFVLPKSLGT